MNNKGFTLIELLVVIAIIGILSGIVITALGGAQTKAKDAKIQSEMGQLRSAAELYALSNNNTYGKGGLNGRDTLGCTDSAGMFQDPTLVKYISSILSNVKIGSTYVQCVTRPSGTTNATSWAVVALLPSSSVPTDEKWWCVDSSGYNGKVIYGVSGGPRWFKSGGGRESRKIECNPVTTS
ncbi:MAG: hypothetical protein A2571_02990 [Candidatus Vogelbacteria bacterium RIFOXYD1_FULL_44_32]|uniref:Type II secretion system protein GspG C-terminal domain-containing protein n=1 Tax=Candidatus Vogelbacteria bacterium RIFOXYD1_FULL_44_32 TaxID=1802438 RepID=A0A1G2QDZ6_9BACT|nr:MAG: hypothetical protein A2571_02990 [Candidatus Vogelbacteria bacterium RIFOXYD1_FULL_44_32]